MDSPIPPGPEEGLRPNPEPNPSEAQKVISASDIQAVNPQNLVSDIEVCEPEIFYQIYERAFVAAKAANDEPAMDVYRLFAQVCSIVLRPSDPGNVWGPRFVMSNGAQSPTPEDFRGEQTEGLATAVDGAANPGLRARIADVAWSNNRRDGASAAAAINAYCDVAIGLASGNLKPSFGRDPLHEALPALQRAMQIATLTTKKAKRPPRVAEVFEILYAAARKRLDITTFVKAADLAMSYGLREPGVAVVELEEAAAATPVGTFPLAVKSAWDLAARHYHNLNNKEARQRCLAAAVEHTLAMREQVKGSAAAEAGWTMEALQQLRHIDGMDDRIEALEVELRRLQRASLKQMGHFGAPLELGDTPEKIAEHFNNMTLSDALRAFAMLAGSPDPDKLRAQALEVGKSSPLLAMMPVGHLDSEGRTETKSPGAPTDGEPKESWFLHMIGMSESHRRARVIAGLIDPARMTIQARFGIVERHFGAIVGISGFIPDGQKPIVALGFARLFQGDFMSATHLLIPQLEPCLRHLLSINGHDPSKRRDDSTEEDLSLNNLYVRFRPQLEQILTPAIASEIDRLFNAKPGPSIRHDFAHGQLSAGGCFSADVYYANWMLYRLCCLLVMKGWDQFVTPQLESNE